MLFRSLLAAVFCLFALPAAAQICFPNPNDSGPPNFTANCPISATGLNKTAPLTTISFQYFLNQANNNATTALTNALASLVSNGGGALIFPPGTFTITSAMVAQVPASTSIKLQGAAQDSTILAFTSGHDGFDLTVTGNQASVHFQDMTVCSSDVPASNFKGINLIQNTPNTNASNSAPSNFYRVTWRGCDGQELVQGWGYDVYDNYVSNLTFDGAQFFGPSTPAGYGVYLAGGGSYPTKTGVIYNFPHANFENLNIGVFYGSFIQGIYFGAGANFVGVNYGIYVGPNESNTNQLTMSSAQCNANTICVYDQTGVPALTIDDSLFFVPAGAEAIKVAATSCSIHDNTITGTGTGANGIEITNGNFCFIHQNSINGVAAGQMSTAILLDSLAQNVRVEVPVVAGSNVTTEVSNLNTTQFESTQNIITGLPTVIAAGQGFADNGGTPHLVRLAVVTTSGMVTGQMVSINGVTSCANCNVITPITVVDMTHIDLLAVAWNAGNSSNVSGTVSTLP